MRLAPLWRRSLSGPPRLFKTTPTLSRLVLTGQVRPESQTLAEDLAHPPLSLGPGLERYLARTVCAGCTRPAFAGLNPLSRATRLTWP